jgi:putative FmdB family regulatory protein
MVEIQGEVVVLYTYLCAGCGPLSQARAMENRDAVRACPTCGEHELVRQIDSTQGLIGSVRTGSHPVLAPEGPPTVRRKFAQISNVVMDESGMRFSGVHVGIDNSTVTNHPLAIEMEHGATVEAVDNLHRVSDRGAARRWAKLEKQLHDEAHPA